MNQKDIDDLHDEIEEEFGLKPPKKNNEKKETVEERIIKRCERVQNICSMALDLHPFAGPVRGAMECISGKDYITEEELTSGERALCGVGAVTGMLGNIAGNMGKIGIETMGTIAMNGMDKVETILSTGKDALELGMDIGLEIKKENEQRVEQVNNTKNRIRNKSQDRNKSRNRSKSNRSRSRSRSRSRDRSKSRNKSRSNNRNKNGKSKKHQKKKK